jgi:hypothetical protein
MSKNMVVPEGLQTTSQYGACEPCWTSKATCTQAHAQAHAPERTHTHTHTQICNIYGFPTTTIRESASMLRYTYIVYLVCFEGIHPIVFDKATVNIHLFYS